MGPELAEELEELEEEVGGKPDLNQELGLLPYYLKKNWRWTIRERGRWLLRIVQSGKRGQRYRIFDCSPPGRQVDCEGLEDVENVGSFVFIWVKDWIRSISVAVAVAVAVSDEARISNVGVEGQTFRLNESLHPTHYV